MRRREFILGVGGASVLPAFPAALGSALFLLFGAGASAQDPAISPKRPCLMTGPCAPGGSSVFVARLIQHGVGQILGQQIVVDNRPGAGGGGGGKTARHAPRRR